MVSQFGSLGYTIMGKTADLTVVQKTIIHTGRVSQKHELPKKLAVHRVLYTSMLTESWVEGKHLEEKDAQPTERTAALWGLSSKIDSRIWVNVTRNGLRLGSTYQEPPHTDASMNLATVVVRGVLPGLRRRRTGLLPSGPKSSFQMRTGFVFHLETKVLESGGRVEKVIAQVAWSPVLSFHSLWWFGLQCHLLVLVHCVFWKLTSLHLFTKTFWSPSCFLLLTRCWFNFPAGFGTCPHWQKHQKLVKWPWCWYAWLASKLTRPEPHRELERDQIRERPKNSDELKATVKETWASAVSQTDHLHATPNWGSN